MFYENLNKSNNIFYSEFIRSLKKINKKGTYILGPNVNKFENNFSKYLGANYCVGVANGLDALTMSLKSLNLPNNAEVLVASNSYIACILSILNADLKPVLVEPDLATYNIDPNKIKNKITKKTSVILAVHLYGKSCEMDEILKICKENNLYLIEDCAQSHGSKYKNVNTGLFGNFGCFSFYPTKTLGALGDGGAITCKTKKNSNLLKKQRNYGSVARYKNEIIGQNSRLDEIQALFLNIKLRSLNKIINHKKKLAEVYFENLNNKFIMPKIEAHKSDTYYIFNIRHEARDRLRAYLLKKKIMTDIHYPIPPFKQLALKTYFGENYPISEEIHSTTVSLPISFAHTRNDINKVTKILNKF
jgi:dTDP-4-amino-4,6-dideoxygalactose transaminase